MEVSNRFNILCFCTFLVVFVFCGTVYSGEPLKVFILAGQSNMVGKGQIDPVGTPGTLSYIAVNEPGIYGQFKDGTNWLVRDDVWIWYNNNGNPIDGGLTPGYGGTTNADLSTMIGPELGFGQAIGDHFETGVLIIKVAWGGKSLAVDFRSDYVTEPNDPGDVGYYYKQLIDYVNAFKAAPQTYYPGYNPANGYEIAGFGWHQGWNDRVDAARSTEYESNMENFIKNIRADLDAPGMAFVIATTGMDGGILYTTVERAQLAMADTQTYPEFAGNVAVVDTRQPYEDIEFWQLPEDSPKNEGYHWNQNAKTYVNIGRAMADAMSLMTPDRCPYRPRAEGAPGGGVNLSWQNGLETPTSVRILRNSVEIAASAPTAAESFYDSDAQPGLHNYELIFTMPNIPCDPLTSTFDGGIKNLQAYRSPQGVVLEWTNTMAYDSIQITRNGQVIEPALSGSSEIYADNTPPGSGLLTYTLVPVNGNATPAQTQIDLQGIQTGQAVIYEPFDYPVGKLDNASSWTEVGLAGKWSGGYDSLIADESLAYGELPTVGRSVEAVDGSPNRFGGSRPIRPSALAETGLLDDGAELWFSLVAGYDIDNGGFDRLGFALANNTFSNQNFQYWIVDDGDMVGSGLGILFGYVNGGGGKTVATQFRDEASGTMLSGIVTGSFSGAVYATGQYGLVVGKITWGVNSDIIELYQPDSDMNLGPVTSSLTVSVDQSTYDTITFARSGQVVMDEIRFGASYEDVIGADIGKTDPIVDAGKDMITWSGQYIQLNPTVTNKMEADLTYKWTASTSAGVQFSDDEDPAPTVTITNASTSNPTTVTITLAVNNIGRSAPDVVDTLEIDVYDNSCKAALAGNSAEHPTDIAGGDCITNIIDLAELAKTWLNNKSMKAPEIK